MPSPVPKSGWAAGSGNDEEGAGMTGCDSMDHPIKSSDDNGLRVMTTGARLTLKLPSFICKSCTQMIGDRLHRRGCILADQHTKGIVREWRQTMFEAKCNDRPLAY